MSGFVYHHTCTAHLPWILASGHLKPLRDKVTGLPDPDFLWATTDPRGDRTASIGWAALRAGDALAVRFTCRAEDFQPWNAAWRSHPAWTQSHVNILENAARGSNPRDWYCRIEPLSLGQVIAIETKGYRDAGWRKFEREGVRLWAKQAEGYLGVLIGGRVFASRRCRFQNGLEGYEIMPSFEAAEAA
jgi:hypothetical protein